MTYIFVIFYTSLLEGMMKTKLTLRLDEALIKKAKAQAQKRGKSVSQLVADYFTVLDVVNKKPQEDKKYSPITESLRGALRGAKVDKEDYYRYLEEKYR
ncbi:MAG: hypothetical protein ACI8V2_004661 [Candidatus Latescibacterota bacterium]